MKIVNKEQIAEIYAENMAKINRLTKENEDLRIKYFFLQYGVRIGGIVRSTRNVTEDGIGKLYRVTRFSRWGDLGLPHIMGVVRKKDGTYGTAVHELSDMWELVKDGGK